MLTEEKSTLLLQGILTEVANLLFRHCVMSWITNQSVDVICLTSQKMIS